MGRMILCTGVRAKTPYCFDISEKNNIRTTDLLDNLCVVVATVQTLRVNDTEGRKVYDDNENYQDFCQHLQEYHIDILHSCKVYQ